MKTVEQAIRWCVPQCLLDVASAVDWPQVRYPVGLLADGLRMLAHSKKRNLPPVKKNGPPKPQGAPTPSVAPDVPQPVLDVFNGIDWTQVAEQEQYAMARELSEFVFGPFANLPRRHWR